jgi:nitroreductase/Pyruvate/2-oxoacid:ferredoxin oxidoreductase delta subunit
MKIITIDKKRCNNCGTCVKACPANLFFNNNRVEFIDKYKRCVECGHCVAVCSNDAIVYEIDKEDSDFLTLDNTNGKIDFNQFEQLINKNRSIRNYIDKDVPADKIKQILDIMQKAPSAHNSRLYSFIVVKNQGTKQFLIDETVRILNRYTGLIRFRKLLKPFISKELYKSINKPNTKNLLKKLIEDCKAGEDKIFLNAPVIILIHTPKIPKFSLIDSSIAFTYGDLAAHTLGLGTCWMGFATNSLYDNPRAKKYFDIPKDNIITGVITLGYPSIEYKKIPPRKSKKVQWYE